MLEPEPRYAAKCRYLQMTFGNKSDAGLVNICRHIIRDGSTCVGPFLDDTVTRCGIWELQLEGVLRSEGWR